MILYIFVGCMWLYHTLCTCSYCVHILIAFKCIIYWEKRKRILALLYAFSIWSVSANCASMEIHFLRVSPAKCLGFVQISLLLFASLRIADYCTWKRSYCWSQTLFNFCFISIWNISGSLSYLRLVYRSLNTLPLCCGSFCYSVCLLALLIMSYSYVSDI